MRQAQFDDSGDDYDLDLDQRTRGMMGGRSGRIILLGDGTEVLTDSDEQEMFDHEEEDKDLDSQVSKSQSEREGTPGPTSEKVGEVSHTPESTNNGDPFDSPSSTTTEKSLTSENPKTYKKAAGDSALPEKLDTSVAGKA